MRQAVTNSLPPTKTSLPTSSNDLQTLVPHKHQHHAIDNLGWSQVHDSNNESNLEVRLNTTPRVA